jgi:hypothetical protein
MVDLTTALAQIAAKAKMDVEKVESARIELYGPSGGGKTVIAAMILRYLVPPDKIILDVDTSEGYVSWKNHPGLSDGIVVIPFTTLEDVKTLAQGIKDKIPPFDNVGGIMLDEASKMAEQDAIRVNRGRQAGEYGDKMRASANVIAEGPDYMIALERWREAFFMLNDIRDLNIVVTAHQGEKKDKNGNIIGLFPQFSPKINAATKEYMHLVAHLVGTVRADPTNPGVPVYTRTAQVHPTIMIDAKCRMNFTQTTVNADDLPGLIRDWVAPGPYLAQPLDKAVPDEPIKETLMSGVTGELTEAEPEENQTENLDFGLESF